MEKIGTIDEYISRFDRDRRIILEKVRETVRNAAPEATETISYGMPAFKLKKILVYFAAYRNHIGFYPTATGIEAFKRELSGYKHSKGAIRFPLDKPLPYDLIEKIVKYRVKEAGK